MSLGLQRFIARGFEFLAASPRRHFIFSSFPRSVAPHVAQFRSWGEMYVEAEEESGYEYDTLSVAKRVAARFEFRIRIRNLSFLHHRLVAWRLVLSFILAALHQIDWAAICCGVQSRRGKRDTVFT